jgi:large subunit ribosomal protein L23
MSEKMTKHVLSDDKMYDLIVRPVVTEKSSQQMAFNQYVFEVAKTAKKPEIKAAIEKIFKVTVLSVNTLILKGKTKRFKGRMGQRSDRKKAMITLKQGHTIDTSVGN